MENHPIPQDITGFQFKLIGNMTVKQFAYLAAGVVLAWITFVLPISLIIRIPFACIFTIMGVAFAFIPVEGRPFDVMVTHLVKALLNPTQFVYQKIGGKLYFPTIAGSVGQPTQQIQQSTADISGEKLKAFLNALPKSPKNKLDEKEMVFFQSLGIGATPQPIPPIIPPYVPPHVFSTSSISPVGNAQNIPEDNETEVQEQELETEAKSLQRQLEEAKQQEQAQVGQGTYETAHKKVVELEQTLNDTMLQKKELEKELMSLKRQLETQQQKVYKPSLAVEEKTETKNVRSIPKAMGKKIGVPSAPEFPNLITGILKDPRGNPLSNILVEIKDSDGNPVRAFKTNALGQFASATPVTNGTYSVEFEDPKSQNKFDVIEIVANGQIILPIEVISVDTREELRRSLFN